MDLLAVQNEYSMLSLSLFHSYCVVILSSIHEVARNLLSKSANPSSTVIYNISVYWPHFNLNMITVIEKTQNKIKSL